LFSGHRTSDELTRVKDRGRKIGRGP
jgi:hypothetical protein